MKKRGSTLIQVLMVITVLALLAASVIPISNYAVLLSARNYKARQAYLNARSGIAIAKQMVINKYIKSLAFADFYIICGSTNAITTSPAYTAPSTTDKYAVTVDYVSGFSFQIISTGYNGGVSRKVSYKFDLVSGLCWEFNTDGVTEGWTASANLGTPVVAGGYYKGLFSTATPYITSKDVSATSFNLYNNTDVRIKYKNTTISGPGVTATLYFITTTDTTWNAAKSKSFTITANDTGYTEYPINMSSVASWTGTLKQLRVVLSNATSGSVEVDYIRIYPRTAAPSASIMPRSSPTVTNYSFGS